MMTAGCPEGVLDERFDRIFPATKLKSGAEPVSAVDMKQRRVYFALQFEDPDLLVPVLQPLLFLGYNLDRQNPDLRWFQDFDSYRAGVRYENGDPQERSSFQAYGSDEGQHIFEYHHALERLMWCEMSRSGIANIDEHILKSATESPL